VGLFRRREAQMMLESIEKRGKRSRLTIIAIALVVLVLPSANAQEEVATVPFPAGAELQAKLDKLQRGQDQIAKEIATLKRLIEVGPPTARVPQPTLPSSLSVEASPFRGDVRGSVAIIEFGDFECPYCGQFESDIYPQITKNYINTGKVRYYFRDLPLPMHSHAMPAARAARCAGEQDKYWEMHDSLFANQSSLSDKSLSDRARALGLDTAKFDECLASTRYLDDIRASTAEAQKFGIAGTPTFLVGIIRPDGNTIEIRKGITGAQRYETFQAALDDLLAQTEQKK
jgi:protein-disulfide isomerase